MTDKEKIITDLKQALDGLDVTSNLRLVLINTIEYLQKESISGDFEEALASEWKAYNDRGAATVDALEDNTQELAFAKGFYRGSNWKEKKDQEIIETAIHHAYHNGRLEMKEKMMANAIDAEVLENYDGKVIKYDETILDEKLSNCKVFDKVKVIVIKEEEI